MSTYQTLKMALPFPSWKREGQKMSERKKKTTFVKKRTLPTGWRRVQCLTDCATRTFVNTAYILSLNKAAAVLHVSVRKERFRINFWRCQRNKLSKMALPLPELKKRRKKKGERKKRHLLKKSRTNRLTASPMPNRLCYENIRLRALNFIVK